MYELNQFAGVIKIFIPAAIVVVLQIIKALLKNKNIKLKNEDSWIWIVLLTGIPAAVIHFFVYEKVSFGFTEFIWTAFIYAAVAAIYYKVFKVGGKSIGQWFANGENNE